MAFYIFILGFVRKESNLSKMKAFNQLLKTKLTLVNEFFKLFNNAQFWLSRFF